MKIQMSLISDKINLLIVGKPNSGKSTLFNHLCGEYISPTGEEYGLTKKKYSSEFQFANYIFNINDTPGLRRKNKISDKDEEIRNKKTLSTLRKVDVVLLLIDSVENITRQDFRLLDNAINKKKIIFTIFTKFDLVDEKKSYRKKTLKYLSNNFSNHNEINIEFISVHNKLNINKLLKKIIEKINLLHIRLPKKDIKIFTNKLLKENKFPKQKGVSIKSKYVVQTDLTFPSFKIFLNTNKKVNQNYINYFTKQFRNYFNLTGIPLDLIFMRSKNPYQAKKK
tara:strand:+ start:2745 stop:3587 length:843 start_codon:yes stop_codon:yes gene_type:complete